MSLVQSHEPARRRKNASALLLALLRFVFVAAVTFLGLIAVTFFIGRVMPIDPVLAIVGDRAPASVVAAARQQYGFDLPVWQQFLLYLKKALTGDFGTSILSTYPVMQDIRRVFRPRWNWRRSAR